MGYKLLSNKRKIYILKSKFAARMQNKREPKKKNKATTQTIFSMKKKKKSYMEQITNYTLIFGRVAPHILPHLKITASQFLRENKALFGWDEKLICV